MKDLIEAFLIFLKYSQTESPTNCSHDLLFVDVDPDIVSEEDKERLEELGFIVGDELGPGFYSYRFGSC